MSSKTSRAPRASTADSGAQFPFDLLAEAARQQVAWLTESAGVLQRSSQAMQQLQQKAAHQGTQRFEAAARKLNSSCSPAELLDIQAQLWSLSPDAATAYWRDLTSTALQAQSDMLDCATEAFKNQAGGPFKPALEAMRSMTLNLPFFNAGHNAA